MPFGAVVDVINDMPLTVAAGSVPDHASALLIWACLIRSNSGRGRGLLLKCVSSLAAAPTGLTRKKVGNEQSLDSDRDHRFCHRI
jgi:hypothetical protein